MTKKIILTSLILGLSILLKGQITPLYPASTANDLVNKLVGQGVTFSGAQLVGTGWSDGSTNGDRAIFSGGGNIIGIQSGIIFSTGNAMGVYGPNELTNMSWAANTTSDATLSALVGGAATYDAVGVQFDFVPESNFIEFRYVFSSEEYNEYVNTGFNDVFGFFITSNDMGDGYAYNQKNIAIIPATTNTAVAINNLNNGNSTGLGGGPCEYCSYYRDNAAGSYNIEMDGFTAVLTASCNVKPCSSYKMKIVIADVDDQAYDSAVFLEENSFTSPTIDNVQVTYSNPTAGSNSNAVEGCSNAQFALNLSGTTPMARNIPFSLSGTAEFNTANADYTTIPNILPTYNTLFPGQYYVTIPAGSSSTTIAIVPVDDALLESTEVAILTIQSNLCGAPVYQSVNLNILDNTTTFTGSVNPSTQSICSGNPISLTFNNIGGQIPITYNWSNGNTSQTLNANPTYSATYVVTATDACGNSATSSSQVDVYPIPSGSAIPSNPIICSGETTDITLTTGYPNSSFVWTTSISGNASGYIDGSGTSINQSIINNGTADAVVTYHITPSANGCSGTPFDLNVTVKPHPLSYNLTGNGQFCPSGTGAIIGIDGTESGFNYVMYLDGDSIGYFVGDGNAISTSNVNLIGDFSIIAVNPSTGCSYPMNNAITFSHLDLPDFFSITVQDVASCISPDGIITVVGDGTVSPYEYAINGGAFSSNNSFTSLNTGFHTVSIMDANGCVSDSSGIQVNSASGPSINSIDLVHNICPLDSNGQITINATAGIEYSINNGTSYSANTVYSQLPAGIYYVLVRDAGNCIASQQVTINQPPIFQVTSIITNLVCGTPGNIELNVSGGTPSYTYNWSHDNTLHTSTASNLLNDDYIVTIIDANNCEFVDTLTVGAQGGQGQASIVDYTNISCNGLTDGTITVQLDNGIAPYTYQWSHNVSLNNATADNLSQGLYLVTVSDAYNCTAVISQNIIEPSAIVANPDSTEVLCAGGNTGTASVSPQGGTQTFTFSWSNGSSVNAINNLTASTYTVTITDGNGCTLIENILVTEPDSLTLQTVSNNPLCFGDNSGSIIVTTYGGVPDYTYAWSNAVLTSNNTQITAGSYSLTITDANNCRDSLSIVLQNPTSMVISDTSYQTINGGYAEVSATGGNPPYTYMWTGGFPGPSLSNLTSGTYVVTITDANNCKATQSFEFDIPLIIPNTITPNNDGKNDNFAIQNIHAYNNIGIEIFGRWGEQYFQYNGTGSAYLQEGNCWDGTNNGKDLPIGTYLYIINLNDGSEPITGVVTIVR